MIEFLFWVLTVYGIGVLLAYSTIMEPVRSFFAKRYNTSNLGKWGWLFMNCPMCTSFWAGMGLVLLGVTSPLATMIANPYVLLVASGVFSLSTTFLIQTLLFETFAKEKKSGCGCGKQKQQEETEEEE
jgi:hypothetical protein